MQKLKNRVIDRMLTLRLTKAEVDFMLELAHYQDEHGRIYGVYYKRICRAIGFSPETFYVTLESLSEKGLIYREKAAYGDFDITIRDNDFSYTEAHKEGYVSIGRYKMFYDSDFQQLKAGEKLLALQLLKIIGANKKYVISVENFIAKYAQLLRVTGRTVRGYLLRLRKLFAISRKDRLYTFRITESDAAATELPTDLDQLSQHLVNVACRRDRATYSPKQYTDTKLLVKQYHCRLKADTARLFLSAVHTSIEKVNASIPNKYKWVRDLRPALINKLLFQKI